MQLAGCRTAYGSGVVCRPLNPRQSAAEAEAGASARAKAPAPRTAPGSMLKQAGPDGGSNRKHRIEGIMTHRIVNKPGLGRKLLLATAGLTALAGPIVVGILNAQDVATPAFEV